MAATILLIDDDADNLAACRALLESSGFEVLHAPDGETGSRVARDRDPAFVFIDLTIPRRDGLRLVEPLKTDPATSSIPVLGLTESEQPGDRRRAWDAGCHGYLPKSGLRQVAHLLAQAAGAGSCAAPRSGEARSGATAARPAAEAAAPPQRGGTASIWL